MMARSEKKACFTLLELLVTIAIILILIGILLPVLSKSKQYAYRVLCMSNLRQLSLAFSEYTDYNQGAWPPFLYMFSPGKSGNWIVFVKPPPGQVKKDEIEGGGGFIVPNLHSVYTCPADETPTLATFWDDAQVLYEDFPISYSYNLLLYTEKVPDYRLKYPEKLVVLFDACKLINHQGRWQDNPDFYRNILDERHNKGANHLFADFHVEWKPEIKDENLIPVYK